MWINGLNGCFTVKLCYDHLEGASSLEDPWGMIWYKKVPLKVQFFMQTATLNRISTMEALRGKGMQLPSVCLFCYKDAESTSLLLLHCPFAWEVWFRISWDFDLVWISPPIY